MECIREISPIESSVVTAGDIICACLVDVGCSVSNMPSSIDGSIAYCGKYELFDPELVTSEDIEGLPTYWSAVYRLHTASDRTDCVRLGYRYVHCPKDILPSYPRVPCKGIFVLEREDDPPILTGNDLVHIGGEILEYLDEEVSPPLPFW